MNRNIPLVVAIGVGVMSGFYIWEPSLKKYQRESKGTWQYEVVQQTRAEEMNSHADSIAGSDKASPSGAPAESVASDKPSPAKTDKEQKP
ncbi:hypothetical protein BGZ76_002521 [Entomortierella beljakovae]|nr:hypothetical protein BGZ76_002521 [Entomortierella beljakovae]